MVPTSPVSPQRRLNTMLSAVLDTNFWLATHVTIINVGYAAGMLAAGIAHVYIFGKLLGIKKDDPGFYRTITRMVYGSTCFGLLFALSITLCISRRLREIRLSRWRP